MAGQVKYFFAFLLVFHVSFVSCRPDYHQHFSQYIRDETYTESSLSSTTGISTGKSENISILDNHPSSNNDAYEKPVQSAYSSIYDEDKMHTIQMIRWGLVIGCIVAVGLIICCIAVCCPQRFKGRERRGFIISTNAPDQPMANLMQPHIPQAVAVQYFPPGIHSPQNPPPYGTQPIQQQFQHPLSENLMQQNPMQPMDQQQNSMQPMVQQQPLLPYGNSNPEAVSPPYPTKN